MIPHPSLLDLPRRLLAVALAPALATAGCVARASPAGLAPAPGWAPWAALAFSAGVMLFVMAMARPRD